MSFSCDKQTLDDLNIPGRYKPDSILHLFGGVSTRGGQQLLEDLFRNPLTDEVEINRRSALFRYFGEQSFPFDRELLAAMENYLNGAGGGNLLAAMMGTAWKKLLRSVVRDETYGIQEAGLWACIEVLNQLLAFMEKLQGEDYREQVLGVKAILSYRRVKRMLGERRGLSWRKVAYYDLLLRKTLSREMQTILEIIYHLDICITVGNVATAKGFSYARALPKEENFFEAAGLRHPRLERAVTNPLLLGEDRNLLFLTGANMAGKSTFMKAVGINVYLAHMGFPVAAEELVFSVKAGLYTSINVADDLSQGYSHFYAEVQRVKKVAEEVRDKDNLMVIFDELFKGTNVKDAYDATLAVTEAFAEYRGCFFIISTHIIEVGHTLMERCDNLLFAYLPTVMDGAIPRYTYRLQPGITSDRQGMIIIENEKILEILES